MRSLFWVALTLFLSGLVLASCQTPPPSGPPGRPKTITVVMDNNYPPFAFLDSNGNMQGITVDQWQLWQQKTGIAVTITGMDWSKATQAMEAGQFDVIDTLFYNESRAALYDFSQPYATIDVPIYFNNTISGITDAESLKGFPVAVKSGDAVIDFLQSKGVTNLYEYPSYEAIIKAAASRDVIIFAVDKPPADYFLSLYSLQKKFNSTQPLYSGQFHRAVLKGNTTLLETVENGFGLISQSEYAAIDSKWYGTAAINPTYFMVAGIIGGGIILIILFLLIWNYALQANVKRKTKILQESEQKYRQIFETAGIGISTCNERGQFLSGNPAILRILGYTPAEYAALSIEAISHPDDVEPFRALIKEMFAGKRDSFTIEKRSIHKNGQYIWGRLTGSMVRDDRGQPLFMISLFEDITERKTSEKVRDSIFKISQATISAPTLDDLYASIHAILGELMPVENFYLALYDPTDGLMHFPFFKDQYDQTAEPMRPGHGLTNYVLRLGKPLLAPPAVFEQMVERGEVELVGTKSIDWLGVPLILNGQAIGVMVIQSYSPAVHFTQQDADLLTFVSTQVALAIERKSAEEARRVNEARYRNLFEESPVSLWEEDFSQVKQYLAGLKQKGVVDFRSYFESHPDDVAECISRIQILDVNKAALRLVHAETKAVLIGAVRQIFRQNIQTDFIEEFVNIAAGMSEFEWEGFNSTIDGDLKIVAMHWSVVPGCEESLSNVIVSVIDITQQKRFEEKLDYRSRFEGLLTQISTRFINLSSSEIDAEIDNALRLVGQFEMVDRSYVFRIDPNRKTLTNAHEWCADGVVSQINSIRNYPVSAMPWLLNQLVDEPLIINRVTNLPDEAGLEKKIFEAHGIQSLVIFPMRVNQLLIGFVGFDSVRSERNWEQDAAVMLQQFANILSNAIERSRLLGKLEDRAIRDELTGVLNRRGFSEVAKTELSRGHRYSRPVGMILIDLDHLKNINDTFGHTAGDLALKEVADTCLRNIREVDFLGRWGGDEFIILLPESNQAATISVAERLQKSIADLSLTLEGCPIPLTISAGVAVAGQAKLSLNDLFSDCDAALYSAKQAGRNGFVFYTPNKSHL